MGTFGNGNEIKRKKQKASAVQGALSGFGVSAQEVGNAQWRDVHPDAIVALICAVTELSGAVMFGQSRDGGAYNVTLYLDGDRKTLWFPGNSEMEHEIELLVLKFEAMK